MVIFRAKASKTIMIIGIILIILTLLPFAKLMFTEAKVTKVLLLDYYFVKRTSGEGEVDIFVNYMKEEGWEKLDQLGGLHIFERNGIKRSIANFQVKTFIRDGKLNLEYLQRYMDWKSYFN